MRALHFLLGMTAIFASAQSAAFAQTETADAPTIETVTVTAQKRSENVQNVPIAITALSGAKLDLSSINYTQDLALAVPSLNYNIFAAYAQPFIRGVGTTVLIPNGDPTIATYVDGVYVASSQAILQNLTDIDRIEVAEGPQGTLFGRNAVGGAISIYTLTPGQELQSKIMVGAGDFASRQIDAYVSGPITGDLSAGIYLSGMQRDSYLKQVGSTVPTEAPLNQPSQESHWDARFKFVYDVTDDFRITGSVDTNASTSRENGLRNLAGDPYVLDTNYGDHNRTRDYSATLNETWNLSWATLVGITGYRSFHVNGANDFDASKADIFNFFQAVKTKQFSQEVQLISPDEDKIKWVLGLYYYTENGGLEPEGQYFGVALNIDTFYLDQSYSAYGQATVPLDFLLDNLNLTAGLRYSAEMKHFSGWSQLFSYDPTTGLPGGPIGPRSYYPNSRHDWYNMSPKVTLDYKWGDTLFYATYSQGFKAGVYNLSTPQADPVDPEILTDYEIGTKSTLWNNRIHLNTSAYSYDWSNIQVSVIAPPAGATLLQNATSAKARGFEASIEALVTDELTINSGVAFADGRYGKFPNYAGATGPVDVTGNTLQRSPKWVYTLGANFQKTVYSGDLLHANIDWRWSSGFYWDPTETLHQQGFSLLNASIGYSIADRGLDLTVWATNLTDEVYSSAIIPSVFGSLSNDAPPRMYGVKLRWATQ